MAAAILIPSPSDLPGLPSILRPHLFPGIRLGLGPLAGALAGLGHPERGLPTILVGGTNGKGSTVAFSGAMLRAGGWRVGAFTSPSLSDFAAQMRIDGRPPDPDTLNALAGQLLAHLPEPLTPFELAFALALLHFRAEGVDVALVEVGMGGRGDATNLCDPLVSVVTQVALDHQAFLGGDVEAIAREKGGIGRTGRPLITGAEGAALGALWATAGALGAEVLTLPAGLDISGGWRGFRAEIPGLGALGPLTLGLKGDHQVANATAALAALAHLPGALPDGPRAPAPTPPPLDLAALEEGLRGARLPGRLSWVSRQPEILFDGAHNPHGAQALAAALPDLLGGRPVALVVGIFKDKDIGGILGPLAPLARRVAAVRAPGPRGAAPEAIVARCADTPARAFEDLAEALGWAGQGGEAVVVCGSLSLYGPLIKALGQAAGSEGP